MLVASSRTCGCTRRVFINGTGSFNRPLCQGGPPGGARDQCRAANRRAAHARALHPLDLFGAGGARARRRHRRQTAGEEASNATQRVLALKLEQELERAKALLNSRGMSSDQKCGDRHPPMVTRVYERRTRDTSGFSRRGDAGVLPGVLSGCVGQKSFRGATAADEAQCRLVARSITLRPGPSRSRRLRV